MAASLVTDWSLSAPHSIKSGCWRARRKTPPLCFRSLRDETRTMPPVLMCRYRIIQLRWTKILPECVWVFRARCWAKALTTKCARQWKRRLRSTAISALRLSMSICRTRNTRSRFTTSSPPRKRHRTWPAMMASVTAFAPKTRRRCATCIAGRATKVSVRKLSVASCSAPTYSRPVITMLITSKRKKSAR